MSVRAAARLGRLRKVLEAAFPDASYTLEDESHLHAGHAGARSGKGHYRLAITSTAFSGLAPLARHRLVYAALGDRMREEIHALSMRTLTPQEAQASGQSLA